MNVLSSQMVLHRVPYAAKRYEFPLYDFIGEYGNIVQAFC